MKNLFSLKGKSVVLTGAAGFFGVHFAEVVLAHEAKNLVCIDISEEGLNNLKKKLGKFKKAKVSFIKMDQYDHAETKKILEKIAKTNIDVLINNAFDFTQKTGFYDQTGKVETATFDQMQKCFEAGTYWPFQATQIFGLESKKTKRPLSVINLGSMYSFVVPNPLLYEDTNYFNPPGYSMAKTGLLAVTRYCAAWFAPTVRVNALCPGAIPNYKKSQNTDEVFVKRLTERTLLKRLGHPDDLVGTIIFLASDASSYMTGQTVVVDGGWVIT